jgi:hypothetical protein
VLFVFWEQASIEVLRTNHSTREEATKPIVRDDIANLFFAKFSMVSRNGYAKSYTNNSFS